METNQPINTEQKLRLIIKILTGAAALMLMTVGTVSYLWYARERSVIVEGVFVNGLSLGGYTSQQAIKALQQRFEGYLLQPVVLVNQDFRPSFVPKEVGFELDITGTVAEALRLGHEGNFLNQIWERWTINRNHRNLPIKFRTDNATLNNFIRFLELQTNLEPIRARVIIDRQGRVYKTSSQIGRRLNTRRLKQDIEAALCATDREIPLAVEQIAPGLTEEEVEKWSLTKVIALYTTTFVARNQDRAQNLRVAANALDNTLVLPGQVFSFNTVVGPRVQEYGYREAPVIIESKLVPGVGGGVCQVSSTLYNAVLLAGFTNIGRKNHSLPSAYIPLAQDATVVYNSVDLTFQNSFPTPVLLASSVETSGHLTIAVLGVASRQEKARLEPRVKERTPFSVLEVRDPTLPVGQRKVAEKGKLGYKVELWRVWVDEQHNIKEQEKVNDSVYPPVPALVKVGTGSKAEKEAPAGSKIKNIPETKVGQTP